MDKRLKTVLVRATLSDVAREAGVSKTAASVVLNGAKTSTRVSDSTRQRIFEAGARLKYAPNSPAQSLATGRTNTLGVVFGGGIKQYPAFDTYYGNLLLGIFERCEMHGFNVTLFSGTHAPGEMDLSAMPNRRTDGILVIGPHSGLRIVERLASEGFPVGVISYPCVMDGSLQPRWDSVDTDHRLGSRMAVEHLIGLGHRRIAFLMGTPSLASAQERRLGYRDALAASNIPFDPVLFVGRLLPGSSGSFGAEPMFADVTRLLRLPDRPTAIVAVCASMALQSYHAARGAGLSIPEQLSVVGFDDFGASDKYVPPMTTIRQPLRDISAYITDRLIARVLGEGLPYDGNQQNGTYINQRIAPQLIVRESTAPIPLQKHNA